MSTSETSQSATASQGGTASAASVRVLVSHGGLFQRSGGGQWQYDGGETRMVATPLLPDCGLLRNVIANALGHPWPQDVQMKFTLPSMEGMLVDLVDDVDVQNMWEEWQDLKAYTRPTPKLHLYIQIGSGPNDPAPQEHQQPDNGLQYQMGMNPQDAAALLLASPARSISSPANRQGSFLPTSIPNLFNALQPFTPPRAHYPSHYYHHHHLPGSSLPHSVSEDSEYVVSHPNLPTSSAMLQSPQPNSAFSTSHISTFNPHAGFSMPMHSLGFNPNPNYNPVANCMRLLGANVPAAGQSMKGPQRSAAGMHPAASPSRPTYQASNNLGSAVQGLVAAYTSATPSADNPGDKAYPLMASMFANGPAREDTGPLLASVQETVGQAAAVSVAASGAVPISAPLGKSSALIHKPFTVRGPQRRISWDVPQDIAAGSAHNLELLTGLQSGTISVSDKGSLERFASMESAGSLASNHSGTINDSVKILLDIIPPSQLQIERLVGTGASGDVYLGRWSSTPVAIKVLKAQNFCPDGREESWVSSGALARLVEESNRLAGVRHPNLVTLYGIVLPGQARVQDQVLLSTPATAEEQDTASDTIHIHPDAVRSELPTTSVRGPALVYEFMNGRSILTSLQRGYSMLLQTKFAKVHVALGAARGMQYLHLKGIIHGDLKAGNVLVGSQDHRLVSKVADMGMAWHRVGPQKGTGQQPGFRMSLPWYSPERISTGVVTSASDVYAFGMVLWSLWTEVEPWKDVVHEDLMHAMQSSWEGVRPPVPGQPEWQGEVVMEPCPGWSNLMMRCWAQMPGHRPQFSQIVEELEAMLGRQQQQPHQQQQQVQQQRRMELQQREQAAKTQGSA